MTYPMNTASDAVQKLRTYLEDDRPMNLQEMRYLLDVMDPLVRSVKNITVNVKAESIPGWLLNDFLLAKRII